MGLFTKKKTEDKNDSQKAVKAGDEKKKTDVKAASMKDLYKAESNRPKAGKQTKQAYRVLVKPLITEKAGFLGAENKYVFEVAPEINKIEIAKAIEEVYGIKAVAVNIINKKGKNVRYGRTKGKKRDWKKAIVTLPAGKSINIYEGV